MFLALPFTLPSKIAFSAPKSSSFLVKLKSSINIMNLSGLPDILSIMSGVGDTSANSIGIAYDAIVTPVSEAVTNTAIASVLFIIAWDAV